MAKPIKETPVLKGKDAFAFHSKMQAKSKEKVDVSHIATIRRDAEKMKAIFRN